MHDFQVRDDGVVHVLPKKRAVVQRIEGDAVGNFDEIELVLFGEDGVDVRFDEGVCVEDALADCALGGGFDFCFGAGGESGLVFWC